MVAGAAVVVVVANVDVVVVGAVRGDSEQAVPSARTMTTGQRQSQSANGPGTSTITFISMTLSPLTVGTTGIRGPVRRLTVRCEQTNSGRTQLGQERHGYGTGVQGRNWVLAAMIFAVAMTFIDQTIVSIAAPNIQRELGLTFATGVQWMVNGYLDFFNAALFALGGRLSDIFGHRQACASSTASSSSPQLRRMCGLTPKGSVAEAWIVVFRVLQGVGGALMFPAALAIVVNTFPLRERGKPHWLLFFGIAGGLDCGRDRSSAAT